MFLITYPFAANTAEAWPMSWLQFIATMAGHLMWPLVVLILVLTFREQLRELLPNIKELSAGGFTLKLSDMLKKGDEIIRDINEKQSGLRPNAATVARHKEDALIAAMQTVFVKPTAAEPPDLTKLPLPQREVLKFNEAVTVLREWYKVHANLLLAMIAFNISDRTFPPMTELKLRGLVSADEARLYDMLRDACYAVIHADVDLPNEKQSSEYALQADFLAASIKKRWKSEGLDQQDQGSSDRPRSNAT